MRNYIYEEEGIFAYRKLIDLLEAGPVTFFVNYFSEREIYKILGIYDISFIGLFFVMCNFLTKDVENGYLSIEITTTTNSKHFVLNPTLKIGIDYLTDNYIARKYTEKRLSSIKNDDLATIIKDYPNI